MLAANPALRLLWRLAIVATIAATGIGLYRLNNTLRLVEDAEPSEEAVTAVRGARTEPLATGVVAASAAQWVPVSRLTIASEDAKLLMGSCYVDTTRVDPISGERVYSYKVERLVQTPHGLRKWVQINVLVPAVYEEITSP